MSDTRSLVEVISDPAFLRAAVAISALAVSTGMLGCVLMVRRLSLLGDVLSHALLPGVGLAWLLFGVSVPALLIGGAVAGLVTALGSALISRWTKLKEDAAFAALFATMFASGVMLAQATGGSESLLHLLIGDALGLDRSGLGLAVGIAGASTLALAVFYRGILLECFDPMYHRASGGQSWLIHLGLLALVVLNLVAALRAVGAILSIGLFMLPAVTASLWCRRWGVLMITSAAIGVGGSLAGLLIACHLRAAPGPYIVAVLGAVFLLSVLISPVNGILARRHTSAHHREESDDWCDTVGHL